MKPVILNELISNFNLKMDVIEETTMNWLISNNQL